MAMVMATVLLASAALAAWQGTPPRVDPAAFVDQSPEKALAEYLAAWQARDWQALARTCLPSWAKSGRITAKGVIRWLEAGHGQNLLAGAKVERVEVKSPTFAIGRALLWYDYKGKYYRHRLEILMSREDGQGRETAKGRWGVLPTSFSTKRLVD